MPPMNSTQTQKPPTPFEHLKSVLHTSISNSKPTGVLITGPPGSGKTSLIKAAAQSVGLDLRFLLPHALSTDEAGLIENEIAVAFQKKDTDSPFAVLIEDLEIWAPAKPRSPPDYRIIAALGDELSALHETPGSVIFLATAYSERAIHAGLFREDRLNNSVKLCALGVAERIRLCVGWLKQEFGDEEQTKLVAQEMACATPGFLQADMRRLFCDLELKSGQRNAVGESKKPSANILEMPWFWEVLRDVKPSLLTASGGSYTTRDGVERRKTEIYGLDTEIGQFTECLQSVFALAREPENEKAAEMIRVLRKLGTFRGLILHGSTGCGKSAVANLASSILPRNTVNFLHVDSTSIVSSVIGEAERKLTSLFSVARAIAPSVIIVENIDVLTPNRDLSGSDGGSAEETFNRLLSTVLTEVDGVSTKDSSSLVFVIGTTRSLGLIDPALLRPGRFELHIKVRAPDADARVQILKDFLEARGTGLEEGLGRKMMFTIDQFRAESDGWTAPDVFAFGRQLLLDIAENKIAEAHFG